MASAPYKQGYRLDFFVALQKEKSPKGLFELRLGRLDSSYLAVAAAMARIRFARTFSPLSGPADKKV